MLLALILSLVAAEPASVDRWRVVLEICSRGECETLVSADHFATRDECVRVGHEVTDQIIAEANRRRLPVNVRGRCFNDVQRVPA